MGKHSTQTKAGSMMHATGTFEVKITPLTLDEKTAEPTLGRMTIEKTFQGSLEGTSKGEMLTAGSVAKGSAGYVAVERFTGTLNGRGGSFSLQHFATMTRGVPYMNIIVVPDSGTGDLAGIGGTLVIHIAKGEHSYEFNYELESAN
jgi:Protein of unknown function (DUF3224)